MNNRLKGVPAALVPAVFMLILGLVTAFAKIFNQNLQGRSEILGYLIGFAGGLAYLALGFVLIFGPAYLIYKKRTSPEGATPNLSAALMDKNFSSRKILFFLLFVGYALYLITLQMLSGVPALGFGAPIVVIFMLITYFFSK